MTFTYLATSSFTDLDRVRQAVGDVDSTAPRFTDEAINATITDEVTNNNGDWKSASIRLVDEMIARLSIPDFKADWLQVSASTARDGYITLRAQLVANFGLGYSLSAGAVHVYRADSGQTEEPDYSEGRP